MGNGTVCREISRHEGNFLLVNKGMATLKIPLAPSKNHVKKAIQVKSYQTAVGLDVDCLEGKVYWSDITGRAIRSSLFNGSNKVDFIKDGEYCILLYSIQFKSTVFRRLIYTVTRVAVEICFFFLI